MSPEKLDHPEELDAEAAEFYGNVVRVLRDEKIPFLVGGGYAFSTYTGIARDTKDLDLFVMSRDVSRILKVLEAKGYETENKYPHWLAKVYQGSRLIDVIFSSGNGVCPVDEDWFGKGPQGTVVGQRVELMGVEEMIWQKAFIMERHRFDGADIIHLIHARCENIDWNRLLRRFAENWPVLLSHLLLYRFVYPSDHCHAAAAVIRQLMDRLDNELNVESPEQNGKQPLCRGTALSLLEYLPDVQQRGYRDYRVVPDGNLTPADVEHWTNTFER